MPLSESDALELAVVDAALAGEAVDPCDAELAELSVLLADAKPMPSLSGAAELDRRVGALGPDRSPQASRRTTFGQRRPWFLRPAFGAGLAVVLALAVLVVVLPRGGSSSHPDFNSSLTPDSYSVSGSASSSSGSSAATTSAAAATPSVQRAPGSAAQGLTLPTPQSNGRRIVQSSQLNLNAASSRIPTVAEELFGVVGSEGGIVKHSQVSSGSSGYASLSLSIPTANLSATLARLAQLRYATVASSSAFSTDVNNQYLDDQRRLADAKALRTSLLTQLEAALTTTAVDSLKLQIKDAEATIAHDESTVNALQGRISFSAVSVTVSSTSAQPVSSSTARGFTPARAAHDAVDVLKVGAGVALIGLAVLVPLGLLVALALWLTAGWRRVARRRALNAS